MKKKYKKYGDVDEEDLYKEFTTLCKDFKVEKLIVKYLKYMELHFP